MSETIPPTCRSSPCVVPEDHSSSIAELINEEMNEVETRAGAGSTGLPTGLTDFDAITGGLRPGELIVIGARPAIGKTGFVLSVAAHMAVKERIPVGIISLGLGKRELARRISRAWPKTGLEMTSVNEIDRRDFMNLGEAVAAFHDAPMRLGWMPPTSLADLRDHAFRMKERHEVQALFLDDIHRIRQPGTLPPQAETDAFSQGLKELALDLGIPLVCTATVDRSFENRGGHQPRAGDLGRIGNFESHADMVALIHRREHFHRGDDLWMENNPNWIGLAEVIVDRQRHGPDGVVELVFDALTGSFRNKWDRRHQIHGPFRDWATAEWLKGGDDLPHGLRTGRNCQK